MEIVKKEGEKKKKRKNERRKGSERNEKKRNDINTSIYTRGRLLSFKPGVVVSTPLVII